MLAKTGQSDFNEDQEPAVFYQVPDIFGAERSWEVSSGYGAFWSPMWDELVFSCSTSPSAVYSKAYPRDWGDSNGP